MRPVYCATPHVPKWNRKRGALAKIYRHGKHLFLELNAGKVVVMHFGMTGTITYYQRPDHKPSIPMWNLVLRGVDIWSM